MQEIKCPSCSANLLVKTSVEFFYETLVAAKESAPATATPEAPQEAPLVPDAPVETPAPTQ